MSEVFAGDCIGGPLDGQKLAHTSKRKEYLRPMTGLPLAADPPVIPVTIGEYRFNDFGQWHWWPTAEGKAMDTLFGKARH